MPPPKKPDLNETISLRHYDELDKMSKWWVSDEKDIYKHVFSLTSSIENQQSRRRFSLTKWGRLYSNYETLGFATTLFSPSATDTYRNARVSLNVIKSCVDTATAKIAKTKPRPQFLTEKGNYNLQRKAKKLTQYLDGVFYSGGIYDIGQLVFRDAAIWGTGAMLVHTVDDEVKFERVMINELLVDDVDGADGKPSCLYRKKWVSRDQLADMFPEHLSDIKATKSAVQGEMQSSTTADKVIVIEVWHLPSSKKAGDGKHTISISNCTLFTEDYNKDFFPIVTIQWSPRLHGFFGTGIALELEGLQLEINKILRNIQIAQALVCKPRVWVESSSGVAFTKINDEPGTVYKYSGQKPTFETSAGLSPEVYSHLQWLIQQAFQIVGISQLSAQSQKPAGLNSGIALRTYQDVETERFAIVGQAWERFYLTAAKISISLTRDLFVENKSLSVKAPGKKFIRTIKWKEVDLKDDQYSMKMFPTSILPTTPEGKLQMIQEMIQSGFVSQQDAISLMDIPDLDEWTSLHTAPMDIAMMLVGNILDDGEYHDPEPFMDLNLTKAVASYALLRAECDQVDENTLDLLRTFINKTSALLDKQNVPPPQGAPPPAGNAPPPPPAPMAPQGSGPIPMAS